MTRTISLTLASVVFLGFGLLACATAAQDDDKLPVDAAATKTPAATPPAESEPAAEEPAADPGSITVTGTLTHTELPRTKSVEAYLGKEFTLVDAAGTEHNLKPSDTVSHEQLVERSGQAVEVTCAPFPEQQPPPHVSAPMADGGSMPYPAGCRVTALAAAR